MKLDHEINEIHEIAAPGQIAEDSVIKPSAPMRKTVVRALPEQRLPFTIKIVNDEQALQKAVGIRYAAYNRHLPKLAENLIRFEDADLAKDTIVLLAESKLDGSPLGTMRIQTNHYHPLGLEQSVTLPAWLQGQHLAEATRLGVASGQVGKVVKTLLFKAYFEYCVEHGIDWMVITARSPLDRQYDALLFQDVFSGREFIPMRHVGNLPHRVMAFEVATARERWAAASHPLFDLMFEMRHPDLTLDQPPNTLDEIKSLLNSRIARDGGIGTR
ncbi:hypothetical protein CAter282_2603 [Collimonas arenae]|uniref:N-acyl amino acid synthase FeeM catalytic core domain-containing protein n=1 Tax=Collimonas arenae TaxID=279058 RepID=A0A127PRM4_9BURK|nr:hypothetical protein [Collimonas arenae]AMP00457.1 hypothetical protein CAter10_2868 [Collimonas arenae]AMP10339.1 hypothetical protein CAter282_2603 [Collimonas arenae]